MATNPTIPQATVTEVPAQNDWTKPIDQLRTEALAVPAAPAAPAVPAPVAPSEPQAFTIGTSADGGVEIKIAPEFGGEVFTGKDLAEASAKLAKSKADSNAYIKQLKNRPAEPVVTPAAQPQQPTSPQLTDQQVEEQYWVITTSQGKAAAERFYAQQRPMAALDALAPALGLKNGQEVAAKLQMLTQTSDAVNGNMVAAQFHALNQDFPATEEASGKLLDYAVNNGLDPSNVKHLSMAHAACLREGIYQAAPVAPTGTLRPTPPPIPPNAGAGPQNPNTSERDLWRMPINELKNSAFRRS